MPHVFGIMATVRTTPPKALFPVSTYSPLNNRRRFASEAPVAEFGTSAREVVKCRVCGRTLLMGERSIGFFTLNGEGPYDVCELCVPRAGRFGLRSQPSTPDEVSSSSRNRRFQLFGGRFRRSASARSKVSSTPVGAAAVPVALAAFNASDHRRTLAGLFKTLGAPRASVVPRSPTDREVILTVAWEIVWYQFRIMSDGIEQRRGTYLSDLPGRWTQWNCAVSLDGKVAAPEPETEAELVELEPDHQDDLRTTR